ncbi:MAG: type II toxin-antitoxin system HicA family toxin [Clostridia bacterium]|nr:type II toxin-antitoxin system HicA family toxin [Clostridia bacterium]
MTLTGKQLVKRMMENGWTVDRVSGSHYIMAKGDKTISVPVHADRDLPIGLLNKLLKQAGLK